MIILGRVLLGKSMRRRIALNLKRAVESIRTACGVWIASPRKCCEADLVKRVPLFVRLTTLPAPSRMCPRISSSCVNYSSMQLMLSRVKLVR